MTSPRPIYPYYADVASWKRRGEVSVTGGPVVGSPPAGMLYPACTLADTGADAKNAALGRTRTSIHGNVTVSPGSPFLTDVDVYGQVFFASSASPWHAYLDNVFVHGTDLGFAALQSSVAPGDRTVNYESSKGLIDNHTTTRCTVHLDGVTVVPDFPDSRWDGLLGHDFISTNWGLVIAHTTDGIGAQNVSGGANPPINMWLDRVLIDWLCGWNYSPGTTNNPQYTHNDGMQSFGGSGFHIGQGAVINGNLSMPDGFVRPDGLVHNDPFGYVGDGSTFVSTGAGGTTVQGAANAAWQMNNSEGIYTGIDVAQAYFDGGDFCINAGAGDSLAGTFKDSRFGKNQYSFGGAKYQFYNVAASGLTIDSSNVKFNDGSAVTVR